MKGIITKALGGFFFPADDRQNIYQTKIRGKIQEQVYPGDIVEFEEGMIEKVFPRSNILHRPAVANVDQVLIVLSTFHPDFDRKLLDRFLIIIEEATLEPIIVINKIDLDDKSKYKNKMTDYKNAGYDIFYVSADENVGVNKLLAILDDKINVLTGPSGVGKSSIINKIVGSADLKTGSISKKLKRGRHTTRHVELLPIETGGWIADTPGFTSLSINHILAEELTFFFPEFIGYLDKCKFRGCSHTHEPKCYVKKAVQEGNISEKRYKSYKNFYKELTK